MFEIASVEYSEGGTTCEGCVATSQSGRRPTVLLAPDWVGLHEGMKAVAGRVAELGYTCFGLDFYGNTVAIPQYDAWFDELILDTKPTTCDE